MFLNFLNKARSAFGRNKNKYCHIDRAERVDAAKDGGVRIETGSEIEESPQI